MCMSLSTIATSCYCLFLLLVLKSSCAYIDDSTEMTSSPFHQQIVGPWPSADNRYIRTTKFPRIGRSIFDSEESVPIVELNGGSSSSEEKNDDGEDDLFEQRSVHFPRIGRRAFHNLLWANGRSNPHRMIDAQGRSFLNGYDHHVHQARPSSPSRYRGKRSVQM